MGTAITQSDLRSALPDVESALQLEGLEGQVTIFRDAWGIPHIRARSEADLFFAQGFATAQDRLWHMDFDRHQALGRWSEFAGSSGVERDRLLRASGMGRTAKLDYEASGLEARAMVDGYAAGVNAFVDTTESLPIEYALLDQSPERWQSWHCLAVYKIRNTLLGTFEPKLLRTQLIQRIGTEGLARIIRGYPAGHLITVPPGTEYAGLPLDGLAELSRAADEANWLGETDAGSNAWSISGERTASGLPLIAGDSHRALDTPSVYYQVHLSCPGMDVMGSSLPGMPGMLHFGHNEHVGWGMTYGAADTQDLFVERFRNGARGREYEFEGAWRAVEEVLDETIQVRGAADAQLEVTITHHGPVIAGNPADGWGVAIGDPGLRQGTQWLDAARTAMRARDIHELWQAFGDWTDRVNNYAVADVEGNFGYLHCGKIPVRGWENGWSAVAGWTGEREWKGYIPHDELPRAINPDVGYAITCNQRVAAHDYPHYVGLHFTPEFRARRIQDRLLELPEGSATVEDMTAIHAEMKSDPARVFTETMLEIGEAGTLEALALARMREWDFRMDRDLVQPTIYAKTRGRLIRRLVRGLFGVEAGEELLSGAAGTAAHISLVALEMILAIQRREMDLLEEGESWSQAISTALSEAVAELATELGSDVDQWQWGRVHRTRPRHPLSAVFPECAHLLDPASLPIHGDGDTPLAGSYSIHKEFAATGMSVNRYVHDPSDWGKSLWIVPLGASGHPGSPHYADQARLWADVEFIPQLWDWEEIERSAETTQRLVTAG